MYAGASMTNSIDIAQNADQFAGLKMYLNQTFSTLRLMNLSSWISVCTICTFNLIIVILSINNYIILLLRLLAF